MQLKQWLEAADYRITEGSDYHWDCFPDAYGISYFDDTNTRALSVAYNRKTGSVWMDEGHHRLVASRLRGDLSREVWSGSF